MRSLTRRELMMGCFSLWVMCLVVMIFGVMRSERLIIEDEFGDISVYFSTDSASVLIPNDCTILNWRVIGTDQVYLNQTPVEPVGFLEYCPTSSLMPLLQVNYGVELSREYRLPVEITIFETEFILLLVIIVTLFSMLVGLVTSRRSVMLQTMIGAWFVVWALDFIINRTSFRLFDGNRYFALFDDAMISMRYAWNFVNGHGLVWNVGERVEGYSNLLMVIAMMPANFLFSKGMAVFVMHLFGLAMMLTIAYLTAKVTSKMFLTKVKPAHYALQKILFFAVALSYYPLTYWSLMGMETSLLTVMMLLTLNAMLDDKPYKMAVFAGLTYLTRQDGLLLVLPILFHWVYYQKEYFKRAIWLPIGLFALFPLGQQLFRVLYYGEWLPNTYVMKLSGIPLIHRLTDGMEYVVLFLSSVAIVLLVNGVGALLLPDVKKLLITSILGLLVLYQVYVGGDAWLYWRLFSPIMPLILAWFVHEIVQMSAPYVKNHTHFFVPLVVVVVLIVGPNQRFMPEITRKVIPYDVNLTEPLLKSAVALNNLVTEDAQVGVVMAGILPYYTGLYAVDYLGKSDPVIAHLPPDLSGSLSWLGRTNIPGHLKYDLRYSLQQLQPDFTQRCSWGHQNLCPFAEIYYRRTHYYGHEIWLRRDSPYVRWALSDSGGITPLATPQIQHGGEVVEHRLETGMTISTVAINHVVYGDGILAIATQLTADQPQDLYIIAYDLVDAMGDTVFKQETTRLITHYTTGDLQVGVPMDSYYDFPINDPIPTGTYQLYMTFYHPATLEKVHIVDSDNRLIGDRVLLGEVQVLD